MARFFHCNFHAVNFNMEKQPCERGLRLPLTVKKRDRTARCSEKFHLMTSHNNCILDISARRRVGPDQHGRGEDAATPGGAALGGMVAPICP